MLSEAADKEEYVEGFRERFEDWSNQIVIKLDKLNIWFSHLGQFWQSEVFEGNHIHRLTQSFISQWQKALFECVSNRKDFMENSDARNLIRNRETRIKGNRARLESRQYLERWGGASGDRQLDFRWQIAKSHVADIRHGLKN